MYINVFVLKNPSLFLSLEPKLEEGEIFVQSLIFLSQILTNFLVDFSCEKSVDFVIHIGKGLSEKLEVFGHSGFLLHKIVSFVVKPDNLFSLFFDPLAVFEVVFGLKALYLIDKFVYLLLEFLVLNCELLDCSLLVAFGEH